jgi:hypothetical protein
LSGAADELTELLRGGVMPALKRELVKLGSLPTAVFQWAACGLAP